MGTPSYPKDMITEWQGIKRDVKNLFTSANVRKALSQVSTGTLEILGQLSIKPGGRFNSEYTNGNSSMYIGPVSDGNAVGEGIILRRGDGSEVMRLEGFSDEDSTFCIKDINEETILSDDELGGLAQPYLPMTFVDTTDVPSNNTGTYTTIGTAWVIKQHPKIHLAIYQNTTSTTGQIRFVVTSGSATGTDIAEVNTTTGDGTQEVGPVDMPGTYLEGMFVEVQTRVDSGVGDVGCVVLGAYGVKSS